MKAIALLLLFSLLPCASAFAPSPLSPLKRKISSAQDVSFGVVSFFSEKPLRSSHTALQAETGSSLSESDQTLLGVAGTVASLIVFYSEYTLKTTGCGLPAGPFGLVGAVEGISYLGIIGVAGYSLYTKFKTGSGLPAGPLGILGAAEGLSFLAIVAGLAVLGFQVLDYGYVPNAVPMEGGICS